MPRKKQEPNFNFHTTLNPVKLIPCKFFHDIKIGNNSVGTIDDNYPHKVSIRVYKKDINEDGRKWLKYKWHTFKEQFYSVSQAMTWLKLNYDEITSSLNIVIGEKPGDVMLKNAR